VSLSPVEEKKLQIRVDIEQAQKLHARRLLGEKAIKENASLWSQLAESKAKEHEWMKALEAAEERYNTKISHLESENISISERMMDLEKQVSFSSPPPDHSEGNFTSPPMTTPMKQQGAALIALHDELTTSREELEDAQSTISELQIEIDKLAAKNQKNKLLATEVDSLRMALSEAESKKEKILGMDHDQLAELAWKHDLRSSEDAEKEAEIAELEAELAQMDIQLAAAKSEIVKLKGLECSARDVGEVSALKTKYEAEIRELEERFSLATLEVNTLTDVMEAQMEEFQKQVMLNRRLKS